MPATLFIAVCVLVLAALVARQARGMQRLRYELAQETAARVKTEEDFQALLVCSRELGERLREQFTRQQTLTDQVQQLNRGLAHSNGAVDAQRLLNQGLALDQVTSLCELSRGEAALLERWTKQLKVA